MSMSAERLNEYLEFEDQFENPPEVKLVLRSQDESGKQIGARDIAVSTARQCYYPGKAAMKERESDSDSAIADSTLEAGHHTTRMHAQFTWRIAGISRNTIHEIFNAHRFYNTEQQSQRYTEVNAESYFIPLGLTAEQRQMYIEAADFANRAYQSLIELLAPEVDKRIHEMYPPAGWNVPKTKERLEAKTGKVCLEVARYVLPIAQQSVMFHSLNEIELLRLYRASQQDNFSDEARYVIGKMVATLAEVDPTILDELPEVLSPQANPFAENYITEAHAGFDSYFEEGQNSVLLGSTSNLKTILSIAAENVLSQPQSVEVLDTLLDPRLNSLLADTYETGLHDPLTQALLSVSMTYATKLSHTADSQRQRHRMTPGATPGILANYSGEPDYITPMIIRENPDLKQIYDEIMATIYSNVAALIDAGVPYKAAAYLLPNAHAIRVVEQGTLFDFLHRWKQRLCLLAQEEIFFISAEQVQQVLEILPEAGHAFLAPCALAHRAGTGKCPEGNRWCGRPVWNWGVNDYLKGRLI